MKRHAARDSVPDAVVIGAGHNGLVAANLLAEAGWDVLVVEATSYVGGAVRTEEVAAPGYRSDLFSAFYPLAFASPVMRALELEQHGLEWSRAKHPVGHVLPDGRTVVLSRDPEQTAASVAAFGAADGPSWLELVRQWDDIGEHVLDALFTPFPPVRAGIALWRQLKLAGVTRFARFATLPARRFGDEQFTGEGAKLLVAGNAMHADISIDSPGSAVFGWLMTMVGQSTGFPVPRGGAARLAEALTTRLGSLGGQIRTDAPVDAVLVEDGVARGVRLRSGETVQARRAVLADVNAPMLYRDLVGTDQLPRRFVQDLENFQWDPPTLKLDWALAEPVPWQAAEMGGVGTVHLGVDLDGLTTFAGDLARRRIPDDPFVLFGQMTTADPTRSPAGTESAWAYTHLPRGRTLSTQEVTEVVNRVEQVLERHAPGFRDLIVGRHVQSPDDLQAGNPNLQHGSINGGTAQLHQEAIFRPTPGLGGAATPVDRLFLAGSSAHPGGGVHGGPGSNAARAALARSGVTGPVTRAVTGAVLRRIHQDPR